MFGGGWGGFVVDREGVGGETISGGRGRGNRVWG